MPPNSRVVSAFNEMKNLGFSEDVVKPVLKQLLRVFEMNWEPIEDENYRVLADAVLEYLETNAAKREPNNSNKEEVEDQFNDESERPLKRTRRPQIGQATYSESKNDTVSSGNALRITESERSGAPENSSSEQSDKGAISVPTATSPGNKLQSVRAGKISGNQSSALTLLAEREKIIASHPVIQGGAQMYANAMKASQAKVKSLANVKEKGKSIVCEALPKKSIPVTQRQSQGICLKEPNVQHGITSNPPGSDMPKTLALIQPKEEPFVDSVQQSNAPCSTAHTNLRPEVDSINGRFSVHGDLRCIASPILDGGRNKADFPADSHQKSVSARNGHSLKVSSFDLESASSTLGEVRVSLKCTIPSKSNFSMASVDAILKLAEEKCVKMHNIKTSFSAKQVIRDVCDSVLELGSKPK